MEAFGNLFLQCLAYPANLKIPHFLAPIWGQMSPRISPIFCGRLVDVVLARFRSPNVERWRSLTRKGPRERAHLTRSSLDSSLLLPAANRLQLLASTPFRARICSDPLPSLVLFSRYL